jgi:hypothetical protein
LSPRDSRPARRDRVCGRENTCPFGRAEKRSSNLKRRSRGKRAPLVLS